MPLRRSARQPVSTYRVEKLVAGAWRTVDTFDTVSRAIGCYNAHGGRHRILQNSFDAAQRQRSAVLRDSEQDAAIARVTERKLDPVLDTSDREWAEDDDGEPIRLAPPQRGVYVHLSPR